MSDFSQAIKWLKEGKKVRRKYWQNEKLFLSEEETSIKEISGNESNSSGFIMNTLENFEATDWEIYCEEHEWFTGYECHKCGNTNLNEKDIGKQCSCGAWSYKSLDYKKNICKNCGIKKPEEAEPETLKDIDFNKVIHPNEYDSREDFIRKEIKAKAIKWVKEDLKINPTKQEDKVTERWMKRLNIIEDDLK